MQESIVAKSFRRGLGNFEGLDARGQGRGVRREQLRRATGMCSEPFDA